MGFLFPDWLSSSLLFPRYAFERERERERSFQIRCPVQNLAIAYNTSNLAIAYKTSNIKIAYKTLNIKIATCTRESSKYDCAINWHRHRQKTEQSTPREITQSLINSFVFAKALQNCKKKKWRRNRQKRQEKRSTFIFKARALVVQCLFWSSWLPSHILRTC